MPICYCSHRFRILTTIATACGSLACIVQQHHCKQRLPLPVRLNGMSKAGVVVYIVEGVIELGNLVLDNRNVGGGDEAG